MDLVALVCLLRTWAVEGCHLQAWTDDHLILVARMGLRMVHLMAILKGHLTGIIKAILKDHLMAILRAHHMAIRMVHRTTRPMDPHMALLTDRLMALHTDRHTDRSMDHLMVILTVRLGLMDLHITPMVLTDCLQATPDLMVPCQVLLVESRPRICKALEVRAAHPFPVTAVPFHLNSPAEALLPVAPPLPTWPCPRTLIHNTQG